MSPRRDRRVGLNVVFTVGLVGLVAAGCMPTVPRVSVVGQHQGASLDAMWESTVRHVRAAGYTPLSADPTRGEIVVASRARMTVQYVVQIYREGWVQIHIEGWLLSRWNPRPVDRPRVSDDLAGEYRALAHALSTQMGRAE